MVDSWTMYFWISVGFVILWALASILLSSYVYKNTVAEDYKEVNAKMTVSYVTLAIVMMYIIWACCFFHHMNPLIIPDMSKGVEEELIESDRNDLIFDEY